MGCQRGPTLNHTHFVAHSRVKKQSYYETEVLPICAEKVSVAQSDRVKTITLGKMPGRQVIVYDKRAEVIEKRKLYWFKAWGIDPLDSTLTVQRVEVRAGKAELTKYNIRTLEDFKKHIGIVLTDASKAIRYVIPNPNDTNISRAASHPVWKAAQRRLESALSRQMTPIEPEVILEHMRLTKALQYQKQVIGNLGGWLGCMGVGPDSMENEAERAVDAILTRAEGDSQHPLWKSYNRASEKWNAV